MESGLKEGWRVDRTEGRFSSSLYRKRLWDRRSTLHVVAQASAVPLLFFSVPRLLPSVVPHAKADGLGFRRRKNPALPESRRRGLHSRSPIFRKRRRVLTGTSSAAKCKLLKD